MAGKYDGLRQCGGVVLGAIPDELSDVDVLTPTLRSGDAAPGCLMGAAERETLRHCRLRRHLWIQRRTMKRGTRTVRGGSPTMIVTSHTSSVIYFEEPSTYKLV